MDWVVNRFTYDPVDPVSVLPGSPLALPLTFSDQARNLGVGAAGAEVGWGAIPEGWGPRVHAVRGHLLTSIAVSETVATLCWRITVLKMDFTTLQAVISPTYSLMQGSPSDALTADEPFCGQGFISTPQFSTQLARFPTPIDVTANRRLENDEALFLIMETAIGAGELLVWPVLRTLLSVE